MYNLSPSDDLGGESSTDDRLETRPHREGGTRLPRTALICVGVIVLVVIIVAVAVGVSGRY